MSLAVERLLGRPLTRPAYTGAVVRLRAAASVDGVVDGAIDRLRRDLGLPPDRAPTEPASDAGPGPDVIDVEGGISSGSAVPERDPETGEPGPGRRRTPLDQQWAHLAEDCVTLIDELRRTSPAMNEEASGVAEHVELRLTEVLGRSGVEVIDEDLRFDITRHRPADRAQRTNVGAPIEAVLEPGFALGPKILLRARVTIRS